MQVPSYRAGQAVDFSRYLRSFVGKFLEGETMVPAAAPQTTRRHKATPQHTEATTHESSPKSTGSNGSKCNSYPTPTSYSFALSPVSRYIPILKSFWKRRGATDSRRKKLHQTRFMSKVWRQQLFVAAFSSDIPLEVFLD